MTNHELSLLYQQRYGKEPRLFYAPGRITLIGEHTDYNDGFVLPFAIDRGATVAAGARPDRRFRVYSCTLDNEASFDLDQPLPLRKGSWLNYVEGMCRSLEGLGVTLSGADLMIASDVPLGAGLSSSAALEVSVGLAACGVSDQVALPLAIVQAAHRAETEFVGTQSGIMDQYVSVFAQANTCLLIDCRALTSRAMPAEFDEVAVVICDSGKKRALASSEYNQRRFECQQGVARIQEYRGDVASLRDVTPEIFALVEYNLSDLLRRRCRHVITENDRTLRAAGALERRDFIALGHLMLESHESLRFDYEVSSPELDLLVDTAMTVPGVLGSRMTGGGFGGCTITLLERNAIPAFLASTRDAYYHAFAMFPRFFTPACSAGAREVTEMTVARRGFDLAYSEDVDDG